MLDIRTPVWQLSPTNEDEINNIIDKAYLSLKKHKQMPHGQQLSIRDSIEWHIIKEVERHFNIL